MMTIFLMVLAYIVGLGTRHALAWIEGKIPVEQYDGQYGSDKER